MTQKVQFHHTEAEARDFFARLDAYSAQYIAKAIPILSNKTSQKWPSQNFYRDWGTAGGPVGHVLHYTAGPTFAGAIRHFVEGHTASSHWVVAKALDRRFDQVREDLQLAKTLRAEVVQVISPKFPAWHAGWVNRTCLGTEIRNMGVLRALPRGAILERMDEIQAEEFFKYGDYDPKDLQFFWWLDGWTTPFTGEVVKVKTPDGASWHESWSRGALATTVEILRYAHALNKGRGGLDPDWFVAHHQVNPHKWDIARGLDLGAMREAVIYSTKHVDDLPYLAQFDDVEDKFQAGDEEYVLDQMNRKASGRSEEGYDGFDPLDVRGRVDVPEVVPALKALGFPCDTPEATKKAIRIYQRGRELTVDGVAGPMTRHAIEADLRRFRLRVDSVKPPG